jgi:hypothetical protein
MWAIDTALVSLPFQLHEPGARIADRGPLYGDTGEVEQLELTFSAGDRADLVIGLVVTRSDVIQRVSIERRETHWHASYELADWTTVAGLAIPTTLRADDGDAVRIGDLAIEDRVENDDFVWPSQR